MAKNDGRAKCEWCGERISISRLLIHKDCCRKKSAEERVAWRQKLVYQRAHRAREIARRGKPPTSPKVRVPWDQLTPAALVPGGMPEETPAEAREEEMRQDAAMRVRLEFLRDQMLLIIKQISLLLGDR